MTKQEHAAKVKELNEKLKSVQDRRRALFQAEDVDGCDALADEETNILEDIDIIVDFEYRKSRRS